MYYFLAANLNSWKHVFASKHNMNFNSHKYFYIYSMLLLTTNRKSYTYIVNPAAPPDLTLCGLEMSSSRQFQVKLVNILSHILH